MWKTKKYLLILVLLFLFCGLFLCSCKKQGTEMVMENTEQIPEKEDAGKVEREEKSQGTGNQEKTPAKPDFIWIDISGAVNKPGVYRLCKDARLFEAVDAAGGFTERADTQWLNQASVLSDGEKIQVYTKEETENMKADGMLAEKSASVMEHTGDEKREEAGKINLNTATLEELQKIPGIGEVRARAVLSYRDEIGSFHTVDEIQQVPGIKGKTYEKIADYICVD